MRQATLGLAIILVAACGSGPTGTGSAQSGSVAPTGAQPGSVAPGSAQPGGAAPTSSETPSAGSGDVPTYRGDSARTGVMPGPGPLHQPELLWQFQAAAPIRSSPAVVGDTVFVTSTDGIVHALALETGEARWNVPLGAEIGNASPLVVDGLVVVGDRAGTVHALRAQTGVEAWATRTDGPIAASAAAVGTAILVGTESGSAYALDSATGAVQWRSSLEGNVSRSLAASADLVYCPMSNGLLAALRVDDGSLAWEAHFADDGYLGTPTLADGIVFAVTGLDGTDPASRAVVALDARTGVERWRRSSEEGAALYTPAVSAGWAYIVGEDKTVVAVDAASGALRWSTTTSAANDALPSLWNGFVFVANLGGHLQAFDAETGALVWEVPIVGGPYSPAVIGGLVLVGTNVGVLDAFGELSK